MPPAIAVVQGCCQTSAVQTGIRFRFRRQTQLQLAPFYEHRFPLICGTSLPPGRERRACRGYLNQGHRLSPLPQGKTTTPNYPLKHARSGSDSLTALTSPMRNRPRRPGPLRSYLGVIFMRFRGPQALKDSLVERQPRLGNTSRRSRQWNVDSCAGTQETVDSSDRPIWRAPNRVGRASFSHALLYPVCFLLMAAASLRLFMRMRGSRRAGTRSKMSDYATSCDKFQAADITGQSL